jgi:hypothetical protein
VPGARYFRRMRKLIAVSLACLGLSTAAVATEIYRWVDNKGVVHYSDKPLAPSDKPAELPHLQTYAHGANPGGLPPARSENAAPPPKRQGGALAIVAPAPDETIRDAEGKFTVTVAANPKEGEGLIYYLDGTAENAEPTPSTAYLYSGVERGDHSVAAALLGADGKELERATVNVHVMPPTVKKH